MAEVRARPGRDRAAFLGHGDCRLTTAPFRSLVVASPVGDLTLVSRGLGLCAILWADDRIGRVPLPPLETGGDEPVLVETARQLAAYFAGERRAFDLPLDFIGTAFQRSVWQALLTISYGETRSYGEIARQIGQPGGSRAVGAANGRNPISIVAPCHRVVGHDGRLTGFAGGLAAKDYLLRLEREYIEPTLIPAQAGAPLFLQL